MAHKPEKYGLRKEDIEFVKKICSQHPQIDKAVLYILRETGDFALASDLEIAVYGEKINKAITKDLMNHIKKEGSSRVWIDIVHYDELSEDIQEFVDDNGIIMYQKNSSEDDFIFD